MPNEFFDVDVRKIDIGHIIIKAKSAEDAMRKIESGTYIEMQSEFWTSIKLTALSAKEAEIYPEEESDEETF